MNIGLFIPCYVNQFYPRVGIATLELLEKLGLSVTYPLNQTCCGQPLANAGFEQDAVPAYHLFIENFGSFDYVVTPSGSCAFHVGAHFDIIEQTEQVRQVRSHTYELCQFLSKIMKQETVEARFPHRVGLLQSCHGLRGLRLGDCSEITPAGSSITERLLRSVEGITLVQPARIDECCGFGGTFAVTEEAVSVKMGVDRIDNFLQQDAEVITGTDMSCLMHLEGIIRRRKLPLQVKHIAEILNNHAE